MPNWVSTQFGRDWGLCRGQCCPAKRPIPYAMIIRISAGVQRLPPFARIMIMVCSTAGPSRIFILRTNPCMVKPETQGADTWKDQPLELQNFDILHSLFCGSKYSPHGSKPGYCSSLKIVKLTLTLQKSRMPQI